MQRATDDTERLARLRLIRSENVGPVNFGRLMARCGSAVEAVAALPDIAAGAGRRNLRVASEAAAEREWREVEAFGARFLMQGDPEYPFLLAETEGAPPMLTARGDMALLDRPAIGIVGARNASANGRNLCRRIAAGLGKQGYVVVSGLARGIDAEAHTASLDTGTIAVVAGGVDITYPPENAELQQRIAEQGLVLAESPFGTEPRARHFPRRNRIIAGLGQGVAVIEAALRSGSLITARQAGEAGRDVFAVPGSPLDPRARGCNRLIRDGAHLIEDAADIIDQLGPPGLFEHRAPPPDPLFAASLPDDVESTEGHRLILEALSPEPAETDQLIRATGLSPAVFSALVLELELAGRVQHHAGARLSLTAE